MLRLVEPLIVPLLLVSLTVYGRKACCEAKTCNQHLFWARQRPSFQKQRPPRFCGVALPDKSAHVIGKMPTMGSAAVSYNCRFDPAFTVTCDWSLSADQVLHKGSCPSVHHLARLVLCPLVCFWRLLTVRPIPVQICVLPGNHCSSVFFPHKNCYHTHR